MKKYLILGAIGLIAVAAIAAKTSAWRYLRTAACQVSAQAKGNVPTKFELERIRNEITALDGDIGQMVRPIAEYKSAIDKLRKDIARSETTLDKQKKLLLEVVEDLQAGKQIVINDRTIAPDQVRRQLQRDTDRMKVLEKQLGVQRQVL